MIVMCINQLVLFRLSTYTTLARSPERINITLFTKYLRRSRGPKYITITVEILVSKHEVVQMEIISSGYNESISFQNSKKIKIYAEIS
jgi:hypothetical protein